MKKSTKKPPIFQWPGDTDRIFICGRTGSGKTQAAAWHLSHADFTTKPWIVYDFKGDKLLAQIDRAKLIEVGEIPKNPGIYIARPLPDDENVEDHLMSIWQTENIGLYIDEGYMIPQRSKGLRALVTQGRSKHIPMIILSQQPVWVSTFAVSEADFYQVFDLNNSEHHKVIKRFVPLEKFEKLDEYHSYYYDVATPALVVLNPVPPADEILDRLDNRLSALKQGRKIV